MGGVYIEKIVSQTQGENNNGSNQESQNKAIGFISQI